MDWSPARPDEVVLRLQRFVPCSGLPADVCETSDRTELKGVADASVTRVEQLADLGA